MAKLHGYDPDESYTGFGNIPEGPYNAIISKSEEKNNSPKSKDPSGSHLSMTFDIIDGPMKGRKLWINLNLNNKNEQAVRISRSELNQICKACGNLRPSDSVELHNIPLVIHVTKDDNSRDKIKKYEACGNKEALDPATVGGAAGSEPPWKK